jgi:xanthine dehydrogenase accessory factor
MKAELFLALQALRDRNHPVAVVTDLASGAQALVASGGEAAAAKAVDGGLALSDDLSTRVQGMLAEAASGFIEDAAGKLFVRSYGPPWSLVLIGAVHISQALAPMATLAGFDVTVIDPRQAFATPERLPGIRVMAAWPDEALAETPPGPHTAVVAFTHDPKIDDPGLIAALRSPAFFIGALGSRRTHGLRVGRLLEAGFTDQDIARIAAPVGLDLGGRSPAEIAVATLAEIIATRHGRKRQRP